MKGTHLRCDHHGRRQWKYTVICAKCERVYQMRVAEDMEPIPGATGMPEKCQCGARLAPEPNVIGGGVYHARPFCTDCFKDVLAKAGVVVVDEPKAPKEFATAEELVDYIAKPKEDPS